MDKYTNGTEADYDAKYEEESFIGRGNFGVAMLVKNRKTSERSVAKKMMLEGLSEKELEGCKNEILLLKKLQHPNIVEYKESFLTKESLIIIMEYCEGKPITYYIL